MFRVCLAILVFELARGVCLGEETSLCDVKGEAVAYIAEDMTIYLWAGRPVAYLSSNAGPDISDIYGFNGKHLGWFSKGIVYDHDGLIVSATPSVMINPEKAEGFKGFKEFVPFKSFKETAPTPPSFTKKGSKIPVSVFFNSGNPEN